MDQPEPLPSRPAQPGRGLLDRLGRVGFGMSVLTIILVYASFGSALPQVRGALEMTEMQVFRHWLFTGLILLFTLSLVIATWRRIRWNVINLGVLTVHAGLLLMIGGALLYFATKIEGDLLLLSPRFQVVRDNGQAIPGGEFAARAGESWSRNMPALGGSVRLEVIEIENGDMRGVTGATVAVTHAGVTDTIRVPGDGSAVPIHDQLRLQVQNFAPTSNFYDNETAGLYYRAVDEPDLLVSAVPGLPYYRERYLDLGPELKDRSGRPVPSKRSNPTLQLGSGGPTIPTGWFEPWRLPIPVTLGKAPFTATVTGYLPYVAGYSEQPVDGGPAENPAAMLALSFGGDTRSSWLLAREPARSVFQAGVPIEFRWVAEAAERDDLFRPLIATHELTVEVLDADFSQAFAVHSGQSLEIEAGGYTLEIDQLIPAWPLVSPGFEGATSSVAMVNVTRGGTTFSRTVIERFPHLTQDIDADGVRLRTGLLDDNIRLTYRSTPRGRLLLVAGPDLAPQLGTFDPSGSLEVTDLPVGTRRAVQFSGVELDVSLPALYSHAVTSRTPVVEDLERRRPNVGRQFSAVRVELQGLGEHAGWSETHWLPFSTYPHVDARPITVRPPGSPKAYELLYSRLRRDLGAEVAPDSLQVTFFPGRRSVESWFSSFFVRHNGQVRAGTVQTNDTFAVGRWTLFQSGAAQDHWSFTILGVGNRRGILTMVLGCVLITLGCTYAFYVKPVLLRRRQATGRRRRETAANLPEAIKA